MLKKYDVTTAKTSILKREALEDMPVSPATLQRIKNTFGEDLTPDGVVDRLIKDVRNRGDSALIEWTQKLDSPELDSLQVTPEELQQAWNGISDELRQSLSLSAERVRRFYMAQPVTSWMTQNLGGTLGQFVRPIRRVGLYVPAGTAPLPSSVIMSAVPAQVAGVSEIVLVAPPQRQSGRIDPLILATACLLGIKEIYPVGGAQAIAALAYGTETIRPVDKIFGPGNIFVTLAKRKVFGIVGIDSMAGPTETLVIADESANPEWVAADLIAQAEHDFLAAGILLSPSAALIEAVQAAVVRQYEKRDRKLFLNASLPGRSGAVLTANLDEAVELANAYAPEHLCLSVRDPWALTEKIYAAGGIFIGEHSFEVLGDYVAGPSHVMPTGGSARFNSPLNVLDFVHIISLVALDPQTTRRIAPAAAAIARAEGLDGHANAALERL
ncbi:MAG: histidinol dehydrogenase [Anaerolineae bacterium]|nr:histidinol dehydrogenase [Anaerolineae bacterium]